MWNTCLVNLPTLNPAFFTEFPCIVLTILQVFAVFPQFLFNGDYCLMYNILNKRVLFINAN
jgi:hypothetical protein